jgi:ABC-type polysaccharide/polyol phosphate export permease
MVAHAILEATPYLFRRPDLRGCSFSLRWADVAPHDAMTLVATLVRAIGFSVGVSVVNAMIRTFVRNWMTRFGFAVTFLSGIRYSTNQISMPYREYIVYNSLTHYIMWVRTAFDSNRHPSDMDRGHTL